MSALDQPSLLAELEPEFTDGLSAEEQTEAREMLAWLVRDWAREADPTPDPEAVLGFQREDLAARTAGRDPAERLQALREHVLARLVDRLGARTFALGRRILAGDVDREDARAQGEALRQEADALAGELKEVPGMDATRRALGDAAMEALFAIEGKAMSPRLARESGAAGGPPDIR